MTTTLTTIEVTSSHGTFTVDAETGEVISLDQYPDSDDLSNIKKFDIPEFKTYYNYGAFTIPETIDILDLGCWNEKGEYEPPEDDWRTRKTLNS